MTFKTFFVFLCGLAGFGSLFAKKPNALFNHVRRYGLLRPRVFRGEIRTPRLDSLAQGGVRFTNFYSENMCWVSRASMLTGVYHRTSLKNGALHPRCLTLSGVLQTNGYATGMMGKWHLAGKYTKSNGANAVYPDQRGFDRFYGILGGASSFFAPFGLRRDRS